MLHLKWFQWLKEQIRKELKRLYFIFVFVSVDALDIARNARDMLGGNGISDEVRVVDTI